MRAFLPSKASFVVSALLLCWMGGDMDRGMSTVRKTTLYYTGRLNETGPLSPKNLGGLLVSQHGLKTVKLEEDKVIIARSTHKGRKYQTAHTPSWR